MDHSRRSTIWSRKSCWSLPRQRSEKPNWRASYPGFVSEVRRIFEADEIRANLARIEREQEAEELLALDEEAYGGDDLFREDPVISAARARSFMLIKQLLLTPQLGTS